jgi:hypothetical protein
MPKPIPTHDEVRSAFDSGKILTATKDELELFLVANGQARILHEANQARASEMGETMRQLLAARQSQEMHSEALRISKVALIVSVFALVAGLASAVASLWPVAYPSPTQVYSVQTNPVHIRSVETIQQQPPTTAPQQQPKQSESQDSKSGQGRAKN